MLDQHFAVREIGPALSEPVTWAEFADFSRIDSTGDRPLVEALLLRARQLAEHDSRRQIALQGLELRLDYFPGDSRPIQLLRPPVCRVTEVSYLDTSGTLTTWASSNWQLDSYSDPARLAPVETQFWPTVQSATLGAARVSYQSGYALPEDVPALLKQAILLLAAHWYENREATAEKALQQIPLGYRTLVAAHDTGDLW